MLSRVCRERTTCHRSTLPLAALGMAVQQRWCPSEEGSAIPGFSALRSPFIHSGGTWQAAEAQGLAELWLSLVA